MEKHYIVHVVGGTDPEVIGPFEMYQVRDKQAKRIGRESGDTDGVFWLDINKDGVPSVGAYTDGSW